MKNCHPSLVLVDVPEEDPEEDDDDEYLTTRDLRRLLILDMLSSVRGIVAFIHVSLLRSTTGTASCERKYAILCASHSNF